MKDCNFKNELDLEYLGGISTNLLDKGATVKVNKQSFCLLKDCVKEKLPDSNRMSSACVIDLEDDGFYMKVQSNEVLLCMQDTCFFLDQSLIIQIGEAMNPEKQFLVKSLDFPRLRVNFNGHRITSHEDRGINWSRFYQINEREENNKDGLVLEDLETNESLTFKEKNNNIVIGGSEADIQISRNEIVGKIKYHESIGWTIKGTSGISKKLGSYGTYLKLGEEKSKHSFKLYVGMKIYVSGHFFKVKSIV